MDEPTDEASESAILSLVIETNSLVDSAKFSIGLFTGIRREVARAFVELRSSAKAINSANVLLITKKEEVAELVSKLTVRKFAGSFDLLVDRVKEIRIRSRIATTARKYHDLAFDEKKDHLATLEEFEREVMGIRPVNVSTIANGADYQEVLDLIEWRNDNPDAIRGFPTGMNSLDIALDGIKPLFYIIGGRPSSGKTSLALNVLAQIMEDGGRVLFFSAETSSNLLKERMLAIVSGVPIGRIGRVHTPLERRRITDAVAKLAKFDWLIDDTSSPSISYIEAVIRRLHREKPITAVAGDYIQLFRGREGAKSDYERISEVSVGCKNLVKDFGIPVIMLAQLQRPEAKVFDPVLKKTVMPKPQLHNLKQCGQLEQDADVVALIHRDQEENAKECLLLLAKNKDGPLEEIKMNFRPEIYCFTQA